MICMELKCFGVSNITKGDIDSRLYWKIPSHNTNPITSYLMLAYIFLDLKLKDPSVFLGNKNENGIL